ncbi:MAG: 4-alpha-glucanotransferase [Thermomicrobiales bacterium]|jgi:4-alpha-glucanotransferase|nr:4-alpha-glucanotransferase [Thermomicrobiales bacterium]
MGFQRASGVLAHPTSFPGPHGIGDVGEAAFRFVDWLAVAGQRYWQVMPLGPTGFGDSPYASPSAFAGNPLLISLTWLAGEGLLDESDLQTAEGFPDHEVQFGAVIPFKYAVLRKAFDRFRRGAASAQRQSFEAFRRDEAHWLDDFALYMALKDHFGGRSWVEWDEPIRLRVPGAVAEWNDRLKDDVTFHQFVQFQFRRQWSELKRYANERDIQIIGDIPIFVAHDSADVWANRDVFRLDEQGQPTVMSGVPPDLFTSEGQLWGNPMFDWQRLEATGYRWWIDRVRGLLSVVDVIRIDHFRGFAAAWTVPAGAPTAESGRWERGPGRKVFDAIVNAIGQVPIIVEDLGLITDDVDQLRNDLGLPGMKVLQFAFDDDPENEYLPHNYEPNCVVYTGTHDNQTTIGWFQGLDGRTRRQVQTYLGRDGSDISWDFIRAALGSVADLAVLSLQDVMRLGDEARMNTPGRPMGNWGWRFLPHQLHPGVAAGLGELTTVYGRRARPEKAKTYDPYDYAAQGTGHRLW